MTIKTLVFNNWHDIPSAYRVQMGGLSLRPRSGFRDELKKGRKPTRVILSIQDTKVLGWACRWKDAYCPTYHFYVRKSHRRQGIGTSLIKETTKEGEVRVVPWSGEARAFFEYGRVFNKRLLFGYV